MDSHNQQRPPPPKAAGLNNILNSDHAPGHVPNGPQHMRDSGFYSNGDASSKHTSAASFNVNGLSPSGSGYQSSSHEKTPSPITSNMVPHGPISPSATNMSVAAMVSPNPPAAFDPRRDRPTSIESNGTNHTIGETLAPGMAALRRESVDSRINQNFSDMRLGNNSPYASNNHSTSSIQNTLHSQRNPHHLSVNRISNGYQPNAERNPETKTVKTAPAITGPATGHIARAAEPTKGQAWAFPEEEIQRVGGAPTFTDSRRSSITESIASSQFTTESRLPAGQLRLESEYSRMSSASDFPPVHHHSMQHKQLNDLQAEEGNGSTGSQPYSRTPELRVSHKLAERKRRTEMKELFDQLRDLMPQERGSKASKWEILTKAITEHQKQQEHIRLLQNHYNTVASEIDLLRRELHGLRVENTQLRGSPSSAPTPGSGPPSTTHQAERYASSNGPELPPIRSLSNSMPGGPDSMTGVQYDNPQTNGYRQERF
ncbi:hypothetical protein FPSE5266_02604 [Fusarium pseudograminearum]|nr:hypothetical protein FPSE5266_02604 [Fusarium pseudograminearum]